MSKEEGLAQATQKVIEKAGTELSYMVGNATEQAVQYSDKIDRTV